MRQSSLHASSNFSPDTQLDITALIQKASHLLTSIGIHAKPNSANDRFHFHSLSLLKQSQAIHFFLNLISALEIEIEKSTENLDETTKEVVLAKHFLKSLNLKTDENIWKTVEVGDVIEIYNLEGIQVYRSLNFFKYCSYTLYEIATHEWHELWHRPKAILNEMMNDVTRALSCKTAIQSQCPKHILKEIKRSQKEHGLEINAAMIKFKFIAPVFMNNEPVGFVCTSFGEIIAEGDEANKIHFM